MLLGVTGLESLRQVIEPFSLVLTVGVSVIASFLAGMFFAAYFVPKPREPMFLVISPGFLSLAVLTWFNYATMRWELPPLALVAWCAVTVVWCLYCVFAFIYVIRRLVIRFGKSSTGAPRPGTASQS